MPRLAAALNPRYHVEVELSWEEAGSPHQVSASLKEIVLPFDAFTVTVQEPIEGEVEYRIHLGSVALLSGRARPEEREGGLTRLRVQSVAPREETEVLSRLLPLLEESAREHIQRELVEVISKSRHWIDSAIRLTRLVEVAGRINSLESLDRLLGAIMEAAKEIMEAEASSLMLLDQETDELVIAVPTGPAKAEVSGKRIPAGKGLGGWVADTGQPAVVNDPESDPRFFGDVVTSGFRTRNLICVPLVNAKGQVRGVLQALNRRDGAPFTTDDISLFHSLADQAAIAIEKAELHEASLEKEKLEKELSLAQSIQSGFWPDEVPQFPRAEIFGFSHPATQVGGDYYDIIPMNDQCCALVVADISGKGFPAALLMASLRSALRAAIKNQLPAAETIHLVNNVFVDDSPSNKFVTLFFGMFNPQENRLSYVNAGHNPPFVLDPESGRVSELEAGGPIVGFQKDLPFEAGSLDLKGNSILTIFTDGVTEAQNELEEMYGEERLIQTIRTHAVKNAQEITERIHKSVARFQGRAPQYDDLTLLVLKSKA